MTDLLPATASPLQLLTDGAALEALNGAELVTALCEAGEAWTSIDAEVRLRVGHAVWILRGKYDSDAAYGAALAPICEAWRVTPATLRRWRERAEQQLGLDSAVPVAHDARQRAESGRAKPLPAPPSPPARPDTAGEAPDAQPPASPSPPQPAPTADGERSPLATALAIVPGLDDYGLGILARVVRDELARRRQATQAAVDCTHRDVHGKSAVNPNGVCNRCGRVKR